MNGEREVSDLFCLLYFLRFSKASRWWKSSERSGSLDVENEGGGKGGGGGGGGEESEHSMEGIVGAGNVLKVSLWDRSMMDS